MNKFSAKYISVFLSAAILNFTGCSYSETLLPGEIGNRTEFIEMVILEDGSRIEFLDHGDNYFIQPARISGRLENGKEFNTSTEYISEFGPYFVSSNNVDTLFQYVTLKNGILKRFDSNGGLLIPRREIIKGVTTTGDSLTLSMENVQKVIIKKTDTAATVLLVTGITAVTLLLLYEIVAALLFVKIIKSF